MVSLLTSALLMFVPAGAWALASTAVLTAYAERRARIDVGEMRPTRGKVAPYFAVTLAPIVFGVLFWYLLVGIENDFGPLSGVAERLVSSLAIGFAVTVCITLAAQASIARARLGEMVGPAFGRVLPLIVVPATGQVYSVVLAFLLVGKLSSLMNGSVPPQPDVVDAVAAGFLIFGGSNLGYFGGAVASNRVSNLLSPRGFSQALVRLVVGELAPFLGLVYAFLQISAMPG
jgi:F0F1-type ATP synthase membrane subunit c/vacuolar-type H+-ATPase subunit K